MKKRLGCVVAVLVLCAGALGQKAVTPSEVKFDNFPGLPTCVRGAVLNGDPNTDSGGVLLLKATAGCVIPWHWHTAREQVGMVSGTMKFEMKNADTKTLTAGSYVDLPSRHQHQATCTAACTLFVAVDGKFDIHYIDATGSEITPEQALSRGKPAAKKAPPKK